MSDLSGNLSDPSNPPSYPPLPPSITTDVFPDGVDGIGCIRQTHSSGEDGGSDNSGKERSEKGAVPPSTKLGKLARATNLSGDFSQTSVSIGSSRSSEADEAAHPPTRSSSNLSAHSFHRPATPKRRKRSFNQMQMRKRQRWLASIEAIPPQELLSFASKMLIQNIFAMPEVDVIQRDVEAAVLYVDIAGFSGLMERFVAGSDRNEHHGAERMGQAVNTLLARILAIIERFDGDVLQFSGDAVLIAWVYGNGETRTAEATTALQRKYSILAAQCADIILSEEHQDPPGPSGSFEQDFRIPLKLHVGLSLNTFTLLTVGGFKERWKCVCVGRAIEESGNASVIARAGQLVATKKIIEQSGRAVNGTVLATADDYVLINKIPKKREEPEVVPTELPSPSSAQIHMLVSFIPSVVATLLVEPNNLRSQSPPNTVPSTSSSSKKNSTELSASPKNRGATTLGEMRLISCIFLKIDIEHTREHFSQKIQESYLVIQRNLRKYGGNCNKLMYDDKGLTCLCIFGLPGTSHEDDATRSVAFSKRVATALELINVDVSIGITRSKAYCGVCGSDQRKEYTVLGDGVNLAARLMVIAFAEEGLGSDLKVFVDESTKEGSDASHEFSSRMVPVKGKDFPVRAFKLLASEHPWGMGSRAAPSLRGSSLSSSCISRASVDLPVSPRSQNRHSIASGLTPMTPLSRSLRNMARMSSASGSELSAATHDTLSSRGSLFPCTTVHGAVLVLERIEEMKCIGYLVERLSEAGEPQPRSVRKRKTRRQTIVKKDDGSANTSKKDDGSKEAKEEKTSLGEGQDHEHDHDHVSLSNEEDFCGPADRPKSQNLTAREKKILRKTPRSGPLSMGKQEDAVSDVVSGAGSVVESERDEGEEPKQRARLRILETQHQSKPRIVVIESEAGMGKSVLLHKACGMARDRQVPFHLISTISSHRNRPYGALSAFLDELRADDATLLDPKQQLLLRSTLTKSTANEDGDPCSFAAQLPALNSLFKDMLLNYMKGAPLLLVIDDAQWLDDLSWSLLLYLIEEIPTSLSLLIARRIRGYDEAAFQSMNTPETEKLIPPHEVVPITPPPPPEISITCTSEPNGTPKPSPQLANQEFEQLMSKSTYSGRSSLDEMEMEQSSEDVSLRRQAVELSRLITYRTQFLQLYATNSQGLTFTLSPLSMASSSTFYKMVLGVKKVANEVVGYGYSRSGGNPGIAERLFVTLNDEHALVTLGEGVAEFTPTVCVDDFKHLVPSETEAMIISVTDRLPTACQYYLKVMAAICAVGSEVRAGLVALVSDVPKAKMVQICEQFVTANILQPDVSSCASGCVFPVATNDDLEITMPITDKYCFRSALLRDVVYYKILKNKRVDFHRKIAHEMAVELGSDDAVNDAIIDHLALAHDPRAAPHLIQRVRALLHGGSLKEAAECLTKVHECTKDSEDGAAYIPQTTQLVATHQDIGNFHLAKRYLNDLCIRLEIPDLAVKQSLGLGIFMQRLTMCLPVLCLCSSSPDSLETAIESALAYKLKVDILLFEGNLHNVQLTCYTGIQRVREIRALVGNLKDKKEVYRADDAGSEGDAMAEFAERRGSLAVLKPEEGWARNSHHTSEKPTLKQRALSTAAEVLPALYHTLGYVALCHGDRSGGEKWARKSNGKEKSGGYKIEAAASAGMLFFESQRYAPVGATVNNLKQVHTSLCRTEQNSMIQLSLSIRICFELLRGNYLDATILHKELAANTSNGQNLRFSLYAVALQGIICAGTNATENLHGMVFGKKKVKYLPRYCTMASEKVSKR